jgi:cell wall-associated NlpC family hydrolase
VNVSALILVSLALSASVFPVARGQLSGGGAGPWENGGGGVVAEFAAKSSDDDDDSSSNKSHSSAKKKKADSDDDSEKPSPSKTPAAKKKKKKPAQDDDDATGSTGSATGSGIKSSVSDGDSLSRKKKMPQDDGDDAAAKPKPKSPEEKPPKDVSAEAPPAVAKHAPDATVEPGAIAEFASQPERVQRLITAALDLTKLNLTYTYGSAEPSSGGMDCSGTIYYLLHSQGFPDVPRDSSSQYVWARKKGRFFAVVSTQADSFEFKDLMPGDLMFWTGTYQTERDIPVSHVMLYLGIEKRTGKRIMFGSSDGRSYDGAQRWGVSVFDFKMPKSDPNNAEKRRVDFVGYARIPGLRESLDSSPAIAAATEENKNNSSAKNAAAKDNLEKEVDESTPAPKKTSATKKATPKPTPRKRVHHSDDDQ